MTIADGRFRYIRLRCEYGWRIASGYAYFVSCSSSFFFFFFLVFCSNTDENICGVRISVCEVGSNGTEIIKLRVFSLAILRNENS